MRISKTPVGIEPRPVIITYRKPFTNVTSMEPVILVNSFGSFLRVVKVAFEDVGTFQTNLEEQNINDDIAVQLRLIQIDFVATNDLFFLNEVILKIQVLLYVSPFYLSLIIFSVVFFLFHVDKLNNITRNWRANMSGCRKKTITNKYITIDELGGHWSIS